MVIDSYQRPRLRPRSRVWDATPPRQHLSGKEADEHGYLFQVDKKGKQAWLLTHVPHAGTPPAGTFNDYADTETNLDLTGAFRQEHSLDSGVSNPEIADYYWNTTKKHFRERQLIVQNFAASTRWVDASPFSVLFGQKPEGKTFYWLGHASTAAKVLNHLADPTQIDANGWYVGVIAGNVQVLDNDTFVGAINPWVTHEWELFYPVTGGGGGGLTETEAQDLINTSINSLVDSAPGALNTLNELAAALGDDADFAATVTNSINAAKDIVYVASLPAANTVSGTNQSKLYAVRTDDDSPITSLAHLIPTEATVGEFTAGRNSSGSDRGFSDGDYGVLLGALNITRLVSVPDSGGVFRLELDVEASGTIPRENSAKSVYFREKGTSDWYQYTLSGGADGIYETSALNARPPIEAGKRYEFIVRSSTFGSGSNGDTLSTPPSTNRYDSYPGGVKWAEYLDSDEVDHGQITLEVLLEQQRTAAEIATALEGLAGDERLSYDSLKDTPAGGGAGTGAGTGEVILSGQSFNWHATLPAAGDAAYQILRIDRRLTEADDKSLFCPSLRFTSGHRRDPMIPQQAKFVRGLYDNRRQYPGGGNLATSGTFISFLGTRSNSATAFAHARWNMFYCGSVAALLNQGISTHTTFNYDTSTLTIDVGDYIYIDSERMKVTAVTDSTLTVERGQSGTAIGVHNDNVAIYLDDGRGFFFTQTNTGQGDVDDFEVLLLPGSTEEVPTAHGDDSSITETTNKAFDVTDIDVPDTTFAWVNFGVTGTVRHGAWHRILVSDLTKRDEIADGTVADNTGTNCLAFGIPGSEHELYLGHTSGGKVAVASSDAANLLPDNVRVRT